MQKNLSYAGGIQELSLDEVGFVNGGFGDDLDEGFFEAQEFGDDWETGKKKKKKNEDEPVPSTPGKVGKIIEIIATVEWIIDKATGVAKWVASEPPAPVSCPPGEPCPVSP